MATGMAVGITAAEALEGVHVLSETISIIHARARALEALDPPFSVDVAWLSWHM